jgi:hypothetical protein
LAKKRINAYEWRVNEICVLTSLVLNAGTSNPTNPQVRPASSRPSLDLKPQSSNPAQRRSAPRCPTLRRCDRGHPKNIHHASVRQEAAGARLQTLVDERGEYHRHEQAVHQIRLPHPLGPHEAAPCRKQNSRHDQTEAQRPWKRVRPACLAALVPGGHGVGRIFPQNYAEGNQIGGQAPKFGEVFRGPVVFAPVPAEVPKPHPVGHLKLASRTLRGFGCGELTITREIRGVEDGEPLQLRTMQGVVFQTYQWTMNPGRHSQIPAEVPPNCRTLLSFDSLLVTSAKLDNSPRIRGEPGISGREHEWRGLDQSGLMNGRTVGTVPRTRIPFSPRFNCRSKALAPPA